MHLINSQLGHNHLDDSGQVIVYTLFDRMQKQQQQKQPCLW